MAASTEPPVPIGSVYEIRVSGVLGPDWSDWFGEMQIVPLDSGETLLIGQVPDQAALHGLLAKIRDLALPLVGLARVSDGTATRGG
jgi:hypothetical protein